MVAASTAEIALWVSIASAFVTLTGLGWQFLLYRLSGARLAVRLIPAVLTEVGDMMRGPERGWGRSMPEGMNIARDRPWIDVDIVNPVNVGRAAISVSNFSLDLGHLPWWKPWQRHTISGRPVAVHGALKEAVDVRLEPGQSVFVVFDCWPVIEEARRRHRRCRLRGSVQPAGRRSKRSRWRRRWQIGSDQTSLWLHGTSNDDLPIFQAVWRAVAPIDAGKVYEAWLQVSLLLRDHDDTIENLSINDLAQALQRVLGQGREVAAALGLWTELHRRAATGGTDAKS